MSKNIELELRAEVKKSQYGRLLSKLRKEYRLISHTRRLSVMYFGKAANESIDIRVRITNGKSEVAIKKGALYAHDRMEFSQAIEKSQFVGMVKFYSIFGFKSEVAERETFNFDMGKQIIFSLVKAGDLAYAEVEKMSTDFDVEKNRKQILSILKNFKLRVINRPAEFDKLCEKLSKQSDWLFIGSNQDIIRLRHLLSKY